MAEKITWTNGKRKLSELIPWDINPAQIGKDEARRLEESLDEFGQVQAIAISPTGEIYDGHQRKTVWSASKKFGPDYVVDVRISSRDLTEQERKKLVIYLRKGAVGEFDWDILANNFDMPDLLEWGFRPYELGVVGKANDPNAEWQGMPGFEHEDQTEDAAFTIRVFLKNAEDLAEFGKLLGKDLKGKKFVWFSKQPRSATYDVYDEKHP